jgi:hypothetical protein
MNRADRLRLEYDVHCALIPGFGSSLDAQVEAIVLLVERRLESLRKELACSSD